ncbi:threonine aldolase [Glycocaulis alkaliphilus]|uniref:L-threonine aldolase n=1 Tax=Glycocaulis alkaliphilus TaxID=1434191 RepID=A0A3T0E8W5_9PROT|nr:beta-eliminating lyase-related protein [Glycocaulis alkaliphilus]AZU03646.1 threonine aldolase [Glycocaulis alkaliphilus]GGB82846.1 L-threonine aldolase [Glycocaulis alkaliphilus]
MSFLSDTTAPAHPALLEALVRANEGAAASYGNDAISARVKAQLKEIFSTDLELVFTVSGTASNSLALSVLAPGDTAILCHDEAHIHRDERGAPEFFTGGAKLITLHGDHARLTPETLEAALSQWPSDFVHTTPPSVLSLSNLTESGTTYDVATVKALTGLAKARGMHVHMDGARFANALAHLKCDPANLTWRAGVDVLSLGATKGGALAAEAVILFPSVMDRFSALQVRQKRAGHMVAKMRYVAAQFEAWLERGRWLELAAHANAMASELAKGLSVVPGAKLLHPVEGNEVFIDLPQEAVDALNALNAGFYPWPHGGYRFVTSWQTKAEDVARVVKTARG